MPEVTDDEVLGVMDKLGLDAGCLESFRSTRNRLKHGMPLCCIAFNNYFIDIIPPVSNKLVDKLIDHKNRWFNLLGFVFTQDMDYFDWVLMNVYDANVTNLTYVPCPSCVITKNIVNIPVGCPCCMDKEEHPDPESN